VLGLLLSVREVEEEVGGYVVPVQIHYEEEQLGGPWWAAGP